MPISKIGSFQTLYIRVDALIHIATAAKESLQIPRSLACSANYSPSWRFEVFEQYLTEIAHANNESNAVTEMLSKENDPVVRQLLLFHFGRRCLIGDALQYAALCHQSKAQNRIASLIKAMVIAGRSSEQIALEIGTLADNVWAFERVYFDVRGYAKNRAWLKMLCFPQLIGNEPAYQQAEARWLAIAYERGWPGLAPYFLRPLYSKPKTGREELSRFYRGLFSRAADFITTLEINGVPPSERDLQLLSMVQEQAKKLGLCPTSLVELDYTEPLEPDREEGLHKAQELVRKMSLEQRIRIRNVLEKMSHES